MIALPPFEAGAVQESATWYCRPCRETPVGAPGAVTACGVRAALAAESAPVPTAFVAATLNVYAVPFVRPVTVRVVAVVPRC